MSSVNPYLSTSSGNYANVGELLADTLSTVDCAPLVNAVLAAITSTDQARTVLADIDGATADNIIYGRNANVKALSNTLITHLDSLEAGAVTALMSAPAVDADNSAGRQSASRAAIRAAKTNLEFFSVSHGDVATYYCRIRDDRRRPIKVAPTRAFRAILTHLLNDSIDDSVVVTDDDCVKVVNHLSDTLDLGLITAREMYVARRAATFEDKEGNTIEVVIDLGSKDGDELVVITKDGWQLATSHDRVLFERDANRERLIAPEGTGSYDELWGTLGWDAESREARLVRGWLANVFFAKAERPGLLFHGSQGSGKSTKGATVMRCVSPVPGANGTYSLGDPLTSKEQVTSQVTSSYVCAWDNTPTKVTSEVNNAMANLVTGGTSTKRKLYTDSDTVTTAFQGTFILTSINIPGFASDGAERIIAVECTPTELRETPVRLHARLTAAMPQIMAAIFNDVATILANSHVDIATDIRTTAYVKNLWRFDADCAQAYIDYWREMKRDRASDSSLVIACQKLMGADQRRTWSNLGTVLSELHLSWPSADRDDMPRTPRALKGWFIQNNTEMQAVGLRFAERKSGVREYILERIDTPGGHVSSAVDASLPQTAEGWDELACPPTDAVAATQ
jgi:hypothetical protein